MKYPDTGLAYLFWLVSFAGFAGLHRFYLGKPLSGFAYLVTWGFFGIGTIIDGIRMPELVRRAHLERRIDQLLAYEDERALEGGAFGGAGDLYGSGGRRERVLTGRARGAAGRGGSGRGGLERAILEQALDRHGLVTPSRVALEADTTPEKAREALEKLVVQGFANPTVSREGAMFYVFPEFLDDEGRQELQSLSG